MADSGIIYEREHEHHELDTGIATGRLAWDTGSSGVDSLKFPPSGA